MNFFGEKNFKKLFHFHSTKLSLAGSEILYSFF